MVHSWADLGCEFWKDLVGWKGPSTCCETCHFEVEGPHGGVFRKVQGKVYYVCCAVAKHCLLPVFEHPFPDESEDNDDYYSNEDNYLALLE